MASSGTRLLLPERGPTLIDRRVCDVYNGVGRRGEGSTRGVGRLVFPQAMVEHGKTGALRGFGRAYTSS